MVLRKQESGRPKNPWSEDELRDGLLKFKEIHGRFPSAHEVDAFPYLPSARTIERGHGGLIALRTKLGLFEADGGADFRAGKHGSERATKINERAHQTEKSVYDFLVEKFGKPFVHREYFFTDDHRTRADFFIYDGSEKGFCVDVFFADSLRNISGCLNIKLNKYSVSQMQVQGYPVIFLQMNPAISEQDMDALISRKKRGLLKFQSLMGWSSFKKFCETRKPFASH